jgi:hypothetical protein
LCCLSFLDLRLLMTPLISLILSYDKMCYSHIFDINKPSRWWYDPSKRILSDILSLTFVLYLLHFYNLIIIWSDLGRSKMVLRLLSRRPCHAVLPSKQLEGPGGSMS